MTADRSVAAMTASTTESPQAPTPHRGIETSRGTRIFGVSALSIRGKLRQYAAQGAVALGTVAATMLIAPAPQAAAADAPALTGPENVAARSAIIDLTSGGPGSMRSIPQDFPASSGYRPALSNGLVLNPGGDCSSPVTLPTEFDTACKAHDLGYDLLRYAQRHGEPLGPWARQAVDATLDRNMHRACAVRAESFSRTRCEAMADIATTAVDLNSRRQNYGTPVHEAFLDADDANTRSEWWQFAIAAPGALGLGAAFTVRTRRRLALAATQRQRAAATAKDGAGALAHARSALRRADAPTPVD